MIEADLPERIHAHPLPLALSVPANLLLLGEYAVTESGGHGIWLAPECRASIRVEPPRDGDIVCHCRFGFQDQELILSLDPMGRPVPKMPAGNAKPSLLDSLIAVFSRNRPLHLRAATLHLDTRAFYHSDGRKRGYGSSAAACVLLGCALLPLIKDARERGLLDLDQLKNALVAAHRHFQGGRGSGYDVIASLYGGSGLFIGGEEPQALPLPAPEATMALGYGAAAVVSGGAVDRYRSWAAACPHEAAQYRSRCRELARRWQTMASGPAGLAEAAAILAAAREAGLWLGDAIGVPAHMDGELKALGAGNEIGLKILPPCHNGCPDLDGLDLIVPSQRGLCLESLPC